MPIIDGEDDYRYNYDATQDDLKFVAGLKGSIISIPSFEKLINTFEKENSTSNAIKPFNCFLESIDKLALNLQIDEIAKIYEVSLAYSACF